ncbi:uncharacterized protein TNCV_4636181 [Trichonephila clavipes]|uniref:Uncharacterized protein n=1 Tax=Trichonephila clavipes TaxID=2585209 RepID=A0A8X6UYG1_TRICX|nr:uncharacterized protein TNCV_4636181 [Trichonephila clavipes]
MEFKSVTCVQRRDSAEWNVDPPTSKSIHLWDRNLKETGTLISQTGKKSTAAMSYDYIACKSSLECLFGLDVLGKIKSYYRFASSYREKTGYQNYLRRLVSAYMVPHLKEIPASGECTRSAMEKLQPNRNKKKFTLSGLGSYPGEDMDVCKCIVLLRPGGTLNSRRAASPLVWLVEGEKRWEAPGNPQGLLTLNWDGSEQKSYCYLHGAQS